MPGWRLFGLKLPLWKLREPLFQPSSLFYEPRGVAAVAPRSSRLDRSTPGRRVTDLLKGRDVRRGVLETLRDAETPLLASELSKRFLSREGIEAAAEGIGPNLAGRFSGLLERMEQSGVVRATDAPDGRRRLWEIAR